MPRITGRPTPTSHQTLDTLTDRCPACGGSLWVAYHGRRVVTTLTGIIELTLKVRRCRTVACPFVRQSYRPEAEGAYALPHSEFGLDVIAFVGVQRYRAHLSVPEIHHALRQRGVGIAERTVTHLLQRYEELVAVHLADPTRLDALLGAQGQVILALDGLQPDVGQEVLWVVRECRSGEVLLARSLLSATEPDLAALLTEVRQRLSVPITGVISDGQLAIRKAVATALPGVPHQLCQFHYLREAARPIYEADRHAKKELKKQVRGVRPIERALETHSGEEAEAVRGYCQAVRSALTDDGRPPLCASGLKLVDRLQAIASSIHRVTQSRAAEKGGPLPTSCGSRHCSTGACVPRRPPGHRSASRTGGSMRRRTGCTTPNGHPGSRSSRRWRRCVPRWTATRRRSARWRRQFPTFSR